MTSRVVINSTTPPARLSNNIMNSTLNLDWESHDYREPETTVTRELSDERLRDIWRSDWFY